MATKTSRVVLRLTKDERLVAAVEAAAGHFAERVFLDTSARADLVTVAADVCRATFPLLAGPDATLEVTLEGFSDRIELTLEHEGQAELAPDLATFAFPREGGDELGGINLLARVDRVLCDSQEGTSRMTLVKYIHRRPGST